MNVSSILTTVIKAPFPFPESRAVGFSQILPVDGEETTGPGDGIVNLQGSQGCDRMADNTGGFVFQCESPQCEHVLIVTNAPGAQVVLNKVLTAAGVNVHAA